jgi:hypothetical protein
MTAGDTTKELIHFKANIARKGHDLDSKRTCVAGSRHPTGGCPVGVSRSYAPALPARLDRDLAGVASPCPGLSDGPVLVEGASRLFVDVVGR